MWGLAIYLAVNCSGEQKSGKTRLLHSAEDGALVTLLYADGTAVRYAQVVACSGRKAAVQQRSVVVAGPTSQVDVCVDHHALLV